jgi:hypothetical protein
MFKGSRKWLIVPCTISTINIITQEQNPLISLKFRMIVKLQDGTIKLSM